MSSRKSITITPESKSKVKGRGAQLGSSATFAADERSKPVVQRASRDTATVQRTTGPIVTRPPKATPPPPPVEEPEEEELISEQYEQEEEPSQGDDDLARRREQAPCSLMVRSLPEGTTEDDVLVALSEVLADVDIIDAETIKAGFVKVYLADAKQGKAIETQCQRKLEVNGHLAPFTLTVNTGASGALRFSSSSSSSAAAAAPSRIVVPPASTSVSAATTPKTPPVVRKAGAVSDKPAVKTIVTTKDKTPAVSVKSPANGNKRVKIERAGSDRPKESQGIFGRMNTKEEVEENEAEEDEEQATGLFTTRDEEEAAEAEEAGEEEEQAEDHISGFHISEAASASTRGGPIIEITDRKGLGGKKSLQQDKDNGTGQRTAPTVRLAKKPLTVTVPTKAGGAGRNVVTTASQQQQPRMNVTPKRRRSESYSAPVRSPAARKQSPARNNGSYGGGNAKPALVAGQPPPSKFQKQIRRW